jgi:hypothetical protein
MNRKRKKSQFLKALQRRREEAARQKPEEANEPEAGAPPSRVLVERGAPLLFPSKPRRRPWK